MWPAATSCPATTSIAMPFSACIMISPPFFAVCCMARKIAPSSLIEDAGIGGEELEGRHALVDEVVHLGQHVVADVADDHVEGVVDAGLAVGLLVPRVEPLAERSAARLDGEVDDRGRAAERGGARPGLERVLREGAAERQLHVGVDVDRARDDPFAGGVDRRVGGGLEIGTDEGDALPVDEDIRPRRGIRIDDGSTGDERPHRGPPVSTIGAPRWLAGPVS